MALSPKSEERLFLVYPELAERFRRVAADMLSLHGRQIQVAQGLRTWGEQAALYAQGRTGVGRVVTNAKPGSSWHNFGLALDAVFSGPDPYLEKTHDHGESIWRDYGLISVSQGLLWGGHWKRFPDRPHVEFKHALSLKTARELYHKGGLSAVWESVRD